MIETANRRFAGAVTASLFLHAALLATITHAPRTLTLPEPPVAIEVALAPGQKGEAKPAAPASRRDALSPRETEPAPGAEKSNEAPRAFSPRVDQAPAQSAASPAELPASVQPAPAPRYALPAADPGVADAAALLDYGRILSRAIAREQRYPRLARENGWQGTVEVALDVVAGSRLRDVRVVRSSGYRSLDERALEMVRAVSPLPPAPEALQRRDFRVQVPIIFRLQE